MYGKQIKLNFILQDTCRKKYNLLIILIFFELQQRQFQISMNCHLQNRKNYFESIISPFLDKLYCSPIYPVNHIEHIF